MQHIIGVVLLCGLLAFVGVEVSSFVSTILDKKNSKIKDKEDMKK